jgi:hypothetical protein
MNTLQDDIEDGNALSSNSDHHNDALVPLSNASVVIQPISGMFDKGQDASNSVVIDMELDSASQDGQVEHSTPVSAKRRKGRGQTPIVDDEVRRSATLMKDTPQTHIQLDNEPRRKKGASKKFVSFSTVEDLKKPLSAVTWKRV